MKKSNPNQRTLFQTWGNKKHSTSHTNETNFESARNTLGCNLDEMIDLGDDEEDEGLLAAAMEMDTIPEAFDQALRDNVNGENVYTRSTAEASFEILQGFDLENGNIWIYPTNYPVRNYQYNIVEKALYQNTMVTLPTGLGKTFIAAVIMYNYYRWYPQGKVVFMAPTKPLVAQQIEACFNIMGIPQSDTAQMTGSMAPTKRETMWRSKRVFFLTPQVLQNDLSRGSCIADQVVLLVVDEAHKALGNHAYCQVIREISGYTRNFRVLALSATPGDDIKAVQQVLSNLLISHVELRSEDSPDIKPYTHDRKVDKIVVPLGEHIVKIKTQYLKVLEGIIGRLYCNRALWQKDPQRTSKFMLLTARDQFRKGSADGYTRAQVGLIEGDFAMCISLYHAYELLHQHGILSFYNFIKGIIDGTKGMARAKIELRKHYEFMQIMEELRESIESPPDDTLDTSILFSQFSSPRRKMMKYQASDPRFKSHPKLLKLEEIVVEHFKKFSSAGAASTTNSCTSTNTNDNHINSKDTNKANVSNKVVNTRVMIFSQYRDSVNEITTILCKHKPLVRVMSFIGQASSGKSSRGLSQKEQLEVIQGFRQGGYNTLVATCVGEEGLDIGDVDLIVCFDAHASPIRLVQRMGRTGRKRDGRIVILVTEGKEEQVYKRSQSNKRSIHKAIVQGAKSFELYDDNPRMIPKHLTPTVLKMEMTVGQFVGNNKKKRKSEIDDSKGKIKEFLTKSGGPSATSTSRKSDGFLTYDELLYWQDNFKLPNCEAGTTPKAAVRRRSRSSTSESPVKELSLTEWMAWQTVQSPVHKITHSRRTEHLVEILEFVELQGINGGQEDDSYDVEMMSFLNEEDLISDNSEAIDAREGGIVVTDGDDGFGEDEVQKDKSNGGRKQRGTVRQVLSDDSDTESGVNEPKKKGIKTKGADISKRSLAKNEGKVKSQRHSKEKKRTPERKAKWKEYLEAFEQEDDDFEVSSPDKTAASNAVKHDAPRDQVDEEEIRILRVDSDGGVSIDVETNPALDQERTISDSSRDKSPTAKKVDPEMSDSDVFETSMGSLSQLLPSLTPQDGFTKGSGSRLYALKTGIKDVPTPPSLDSLEDIMSCSPNKSFCELERKKKEGTPHKSVAKCPRILNLVEKEHSLVLKKHELKHSEIQVFKSNTIDLGYDSTENDFGINSRQLLSLKTASKGKGEALKSIPKAEEQGLCNVKSLVVNTCFGAGSVCGYSNAMSDCYDDDGINNEFGDEISLTDDFYMDDEDIVHEKPLVENDVYKTKSLVTDPDDKGLDRKSKAKGGEGNTEKNIASKAIKNGTENSWLLSKKGTSVKTVSSSTFTGIQKSILKLNAFERKPKEVTDDSIPPQSINSNKRADTFVNRSCGENKRKTGDSCVRETKTMAESTSDVSTNDEMNRKINERAPFAFKKPREPVTVQDSTSLRSNKQSCLDDADTVHLEGKSPIAKRSRLTLKCSPPTRKGLSNSRRSTILDHDDMNKNGTTNSSRQELFREREVQMEKKVVESEYTCLQEARQPIEDSFGEESSNTLTTDAHVSDEEDSHFTNKCRSDYSRPASPGSKVLPEETVKTTPCVDAPSDGDSPVMRKRSKAIFKNRGLESPVGVEPTSYVDTASPIITKRCKLKTSNGNVVAIAESEDDDDEQENIKPVGKASIYRRQALSSPQSQELRKVGKVLRVHQTRGALKGSSSEEEFEIDNMKAAKLVKTSNRTHEDEPRRKSVVLKPRMKRMRHERHALFKKHKEHHRHNFVDEEAELSGSDINEFSSDEDVDDYSELDSFIDDSTQLTQRTPRITKQQGSPMDMKAVYRQSLMSPFGPGLNFKTPMFHKHKNRYKMKYNHRKRSDSASEAEETYERESDLENELGEESDEEQESEAGSDNDNDVCNQSVQALETSPFVESQIQRPGKRIKRKRILDDSIEEMSPKTSRQFNSPVVQNSRALLAPNISPIQSTTRTFKNVAQESSLNLPRNSNEFVKSSVLLDKDSNMKYPSTCTLETNDKSSSKFKSPGWSFKPVGTLTSPKQKGPKQNPPVGRTPNTAKPVKTSANGTRRMSGSFGYDWENEFSDADLLDAMKVDSCLDTRNVAGEIKGTSAQADIKEQELQEIALAMAATDDDVSLDMCEMPTFSLGFDFLGDPPESEDCEDFETDPGGLSIASKASCGREQAPKPCVENRFQNKVNVTPFTRKPLQGLEGKNQSNRQSETSNFTRIRSQSCTQTVQPVRHTKASVEQRSQLLPKSANAQSSNTPTNPRGKTPVPGRNTQQFDKSATAPHNTRLSTNATTTPQSGVQFINLVNTQNTKQVSRNPVQVSPRSSARGIPPAAAPSANQQAAISASSHSVGDKAAALSPRLSSSQRNKDKLVILVDSKEISNSQVVSSLRLKHNIRAEVCQLSGCDYIVSSRMAVERKTMSVIANGANSTKLVDRMRLLCDLYDRPCLIIEKDRLKPGEQERNYARSTVYFNTLSCIALVRTKILFSESQEDTAYLLSELAIVESKKKAAIVAPLSMNKETEQVFRVLLSIPRVSYVTALNLCSSFRSLHDIINSSADDLQKMTRHLLPTRAAEIHKYLRHTFNATMIGKK